MTMTKMMVFKDDDEESGEWVVMDCSLMNKKRLGSCSKINVEYENFVWAGLTR